MWTRSLLVCSAGRRVRRRRLPRARARQEKVRLEKRKSDSELPAIDCFEYRSAASEIPYETTLRMDSPTDGLNHYTVTVSECFGTDVDFATCEAVPRAAARMHGTS